MRRRSVRYLSPDAGTDRSTLLLVTAGAVAGAAAGLFLGRRYGSLAALVDDLRDRAESLRDAWQELEEDDQAAAQLRGEESGPHDDEDDFVADEGDEWADADDDLDDDADDDDLDDDLEDDDLEDDDIDDLEDDDLDELDADLASVTASNGNADAAAESTAARARRLEQKVLEALTEDRRLRERAIEIAAVGEGVVELTGSVHAVDEIPRAAALVRRVPGVSMVLNRIEVRSGGHVDTASVPRDPDAVDTAREAPGPTTG